MSKVIAKPFRAAHLDIFEGATPFDDEEVHKNLPMLIELGRLDQCVINILDGRILYIGGYLSAAPGVVEAFIYPSKFALEKPKTYYAEAKFWVANLKAQHRRVQCWGNDTEVSRRWLEHLGFVYEGCLRNYTVNGSSMLVWGLV